jgi:AcrR family transcriptional regulator
VNVSPESVTRPPGSPADLLAQDDPHYGRGAERESAICKAALELLAEVGYDRMSMDAVASRAHASKATIYRRWPGKREMVLEAIRSSTTEQVVLPDTGTLRGDIIETLQSMADGIGAKDVALMVGVLRAMNASPELGDCMRTRAVEEKRYISRTIVERAVARGELGPDADPEIIHELAPALMFFRLVVMGCPIDSAYLGHVADDILVPLLARSGHQHTRQEI